MDFTEYIGDFEIIKHSEIIIYNDKEVSIELIEDNAPLVLKIRFQNKGGRTSSITEELKDNVLTFNFINFERENSLGGLFEPIEVGRFGNDDVLFFNCVVYTLNSKEGSRVLRYSFLKKKSNEVD